MRSAVSLTDVSTASTAPFSPVDPNLPDEAAPIPLPALLTSGAGDMSCIITDGQTGSGKTFTMDGAVGQPGLMPKAFEYVFARASMAQLHHLNTVRINVSYYEIYMEEALVT